MYYTRDHEWIDFQGAVAHIGVGEFKLTGFRELHAVNFMPSSGFKHQGDVLAFLIYQDYQIGVHMPVNGRIDQVNQIFLTDNLPQILLHLKFNGWIYTIIPSDPDDREGLITGEEYLSLDRTRAAVNQK